MTVQEGRATLGLIILLAGALGMIIPLGWGFARRFGRRHWQKAEGEVIDMNADTSGGFSPVVAFETPDGSKQTFGGNVVTNPPRYKVGERVAVLFDPTEPSQALIDRTLEHYFVPGVFSVIGFLFLIGGLVLFFVRSGN